ncbi:MAG: arsenate reductase (glutaredoxin) [Oligoflexia bacterium]|nr:arsenate reductase (glutaredoxin) [Oligoflexia bacterium]
MPKLTIFHNQQCSKSRATLKILEEAKGSYSVVNYLETPPTAAELDALLNQLGLEPEAIVRKGEDRYEELGLEAKPPRSRAEWIDVLVKNPILIERPIVTNGKKAVIGRPPENVKALLAID